MEIPLTELRKGETGVITCTLFSSEGHQSTDRHRARKGWKKNFLVHRCAKRLTDLGLTPGTKITMIKSAPFNGPLEICVRGSRLAIGRGMATRIGVDVER